MKNFLNNLKTTKFFNKISKKKLKNINIKKINYNKKMLLAIPKCTEKIKIIIFQKNKIIQKAY